MKAALGLGAPRSLSLRLGAVLAAIAMMLGGCVKQPTLPATAATPLGTQSGRLTIENVPTEPKTLQARDHGADDHVQLRGAVLPVYFDFDRYAIRQDQRGKLTATKTYLDQNPLFRCLVEGYCDWRGTAEYNLALGDRRCVSAVKFLVALGLSPERFEIVSKGNEEATSSGGEAQWAKDRRVEFVMIRPASPVR